MCDLLLCFGKPLICGVK